MYVDVEVLPKWGKAKIVVRRREKPSSLDRAFANEHVHAAKLKNNEEEKAQMG